MTELLIAAYPVYLFDKSTGAKEYQAGISGTAIWQSQDSYLWARTPIFLGNLSKSLYGTATFSGIAFWDSSPSEISATYMYIIDQFT